MSYNESWRDLFAAIDAKQSERFVDFLTDDAMFRYGSNTPVIGRAAIATLVDGFLASFRSTRHRISQVWDTAEGSVIQGEVTYERLDGRSVTVPFCNVFGMRGEKIFRYQIYIDPTPVMAA